MILLRSAIALLVALRCTAAGSHSHEYHGHSGYGGDHGGREANASAPDDSTLSSYARSHSCSRPGPLLAQWQATGVPFVPFITLTEAHSGSTWFRSMLNSHPCVRSHGETLRHRNDLRDLWKTLGRPTKTDNQQATSVALYAAGLKGFFAPKSPTGNKLSDNFNPVTPAVYVS